jgi:catechol 2,3-dioxygenase-like lactoylglutathione lyase family enzyme
VTIVSGTDFVTIATKDIDAAQKFYGETLGLEFGKRYGQMPGVEYETGNLTIAIVQAEAFGMKYATNSNPLALHVDDMEAARAELESRGVEFAADTMDTGVCYMAFFSDPDGNALMLHHRYAPKDAAPPPAATGDAPLPQMPS